MVEAAYSDKRQETILDKLHIKPQQILNLLPNEPQPIMKTLSDMGMKAHHPTALVHGLLCEHCKHESHDAPYNELSSNIKVGDKVQFKENVEQKEEGWLKQLISKFTSSSSSPQIEEDFIYRVFTSKLNSLINDDELKILTKQATVSSGELVIQALLYNWEVYKIIEDKNSSYYGVIYQNKQDEQLVLVHRSTHSSLALHHELFQSSSVTVDVETILLGFFGMHQAHAFRATVIAVNCANELNYSLSISGHSLGGFLAELSVYYCHTIISYPNVKGVTFDGPGSRNIMKKMSNGLIEGGGSSWNRIKQELDITRYTAQPNLFNSTNQHIGVTYCVDPQIDEKVLPKENLKSEISASTLGGTEFLHPNEHEAARRALKYIYSHTLSFILERFNPVTGRPNKEDMKCVKNWPLLKYTGPEKTLTSSAHSFLSSVRQKMENIFGGSKIVNSEAFTSETSTLGSIFQVFSLKLKQDINLSQLLAINQILDPFKNMTKIGSDFINNTCELDYQF